jgi:hypothetical protein
MQKPCNTIKEKRSGEKGERWYCEDGEGHGKKRVCGVFERREERKGGRNFDLPRQFRRREITRGHFDAIQFSAQKCMIRGCAFLLWTIASICRLDTL